MDAILDSFVYTIYVLLIILSFLLLCYKLWSNGLRRCSGAEVKAAETEIRKDENDNVEPKDDYDDQEFDGSKYVDPLFLEYALARGMPTFDFDHPEV